jgi:phosphoglycolate phosphatase
VVSNKGDYAVQPLVQHFFPSLFDVVCGERERDGIRRKPWPDTVLACIDALGADPEGCVYVGDSEVDLQTARNAHIPCISVTWGFRPESLLLDEGATCIVHTIEELDHVLC